MASARPDSKRFGASESGRSRPLSVAADKFPEDVGCTGVDDTWA